MWEVWIKMLEQKTVRTKFVRTKIVTEQKSDEKEFGSIFLK